MKITRKQQMYQLLKSGRLGNTIQMWTYPELLQEKHLPDRISIRYNSYKLHGPCKTHIPIQELNKWLNYYHNQGWRRETAIFSVELPDDKRILQGQFCISEHFYDLTYTTQPLPMRQAFKKEQKYASGIEALSIMQSNIDPASLDDIIELSKYYEGAVVEFTACSVDIGRLPHRNTIIWEVRNY